MSETYAFDRLPAERRSAVTVSVIGAVILLSGFLDWANFIAFRSDFLYAGVRGNLMYSTGFIGSARILGSWIPNAAFAIFVAATILLAWLRALRLFAANLYVEIGVPVLAIGHLVGILSQLHFSDERSMGSGEGTGIGWIVAAVGQISILSILLKSFARQAATTKPAPAASA